MYFFEVDRKTTGSAKIGSNIKQIIMNSIQYLNTFLTFLIISGPMPSPGSEVTINLEFN